MKSRISATVFVLIVTVLACRSDELFTERLQPTLTPTFVLAQFTTATPSATATNTPLILPTETPTNTPQASHTPEPPTETASDGAATSGTDEAADDDPATETAEAEAAEPTDTPGPTDTPLPPPPPPSPTPVPTEAPTPTPAALSGRIAFSIDDGGGHYDVWAVELPEGEPFLVQARARQPNFSVKGQLLVNTQDNQYGDSLGLIDTNYSWLGIINASPDDAYPFWSPDGSRYAYSNPGLLLDPIDNNPLMHVFIPCSMQIPTMEPDPKCQDIRTNGKVVIGEAPVWTDDDRLAFFSFEGDDGLYVVSSASSLWQVGGVGPKKLLVKGNGRPSDTDGFQVFFSAGDIDGNWEAYSIDLDGNNLTNLSNAPFFQDGLPTVSPDGNWVAFVSDRDGKWGIWLVPRQGGVEPVKLVDLSKINTNPSPWGVGDRAWMTERISWGP